MTQEFQDVDAGWIKEVPKDWEIKRVKEVYEFVSVKVSDTEYPALTVSSKYGITPQMEHVAKSLNGDSRKRVEKGDFVINSRADRPGACGISSYDGSVSMICHVLKPRHKEVLHEKYMHYLFRNNMFSQEFFRWGRGIVSDLWSTRKDEFGSLQLPIPLIKDQKIIGEYLEYKENALNALIQLKEQQLEKLAQQRQSIITEAVTKGLNPNVKMKDSGVEWIGEIPEHWTVNKIKRIVDILTCGYASTPTYVDESEGVPFLSAQNVSKSGKLKLEKYNYISQELHASLTKYKKPRRGDILQVRVGAGIGQTCIVDVDFDFSIYVSLSHIRVKKFIYNKYLTYILGSQKFNEYANMQTLQAGGVGNLNVSDLEKSKIPYPSLEEQIEIANYLEVECSKIDSLVENINKQIKKLKEYRQSLIYEAVTGKIDVRDMELD